MNTNPFFFINLPSTSTFLIYLIITLRNRLLLMCKSNVELEIMFLFTKPFNTTAAHQMQVGISVTYENCHIAISYHVYDEVYMFALVCVPNKTAQRYRKINNNAL